MSNTTHTDGSNKFIPRHTGTAPKTSDAQEGVTQLSLSGEESNNSESIVASKPKARATTPWRPASLLSLPSKPGYRRRWCSKALLPKREAEGWTVVTDPKGKALVKPFQDKTLIDSSDLTSAVTIRELIAMEMPEELAKSREQYFKDLDAAQKTDNIRKLQQNTAVIGDKRSGAYGSIEVKLGDEIDPPNFDR